jgi:acetyl-CoA carboxylase carboxyl transferase subunit beta
MAWFRREPAPLARRDASESRVPEGLWVKCGSCKEILYRKDVLKNLSVCPKCSFHFRISARERLDMLFDGEWEEFDASLVSADPLAFRDSKRYADRLRAGKAKTDSYDAVVSAAGAMGGARTVVAAMEYGFIGGSMGVVVGEKVTRCIERALDERSPVIVVSCSGGARMMEGTLSLINLAEPGALIGFAGPRVIEQTIRQKLPAGFQRSEFLVEHGMIDMVVDRRELKKTLVRSIRFFVD